MEDILSIVEGKLNLVEEKKWEQLLELFNKTFASSTSFVNKHAFPTVEMKGKFMKLLVDKFFTDQQPNTTCKFF